MSAASGPALALAGIMLVPAPAPSFSPGIGYTVARLQREADGLVPTDGAAEASERLAASSLAPRLPPPASDLARIQGSPRARGLHIAAAVAVQAAMVVAGILAVREQREQARRAREREVAPYRPYR